MPTEDEKEANRLKAASDPDHGKRQPERCMRHGNLVVYKDARGNCSMCDAEANARRRQGKKP